MAGALTSKSSSSPSAIVVGLLWCQLNLVLLKLNVKPASYSLGIADFTPGWLSQPTEVRPQQTRTFSVGSAGTATTGLTANNELYY